MDDSASASPSGAASRVGARLATAREAAGMTLEEVAQRTRIPVRHLATIERGGTEGLPATTYSAGFVRSYATAVGLEPDECARQFRQEIGRVRPRREAPEPFEPADPARVPPRWLAWVALLVALVVGVGYLVWRGDALFGRGGGDGPVATAAAGEPVDTSVDSGAPPPSVPLGGPSAPAAIASGPVVITANKPVWVKIYELGGKSYYMDTLDAGRRFELPADAVDPRLWTGRPLSLDVTVGGVKVAPLGDDSHPIKDVSLKPASLTGPRRVEAAAPAPTAASKPAASPPPVRREEPRRRVRLRHRRDGSSDARASGAGATPPASAPSETPAATAPPSPRSSGVPGGML